MFVFFIIYFFHPPCLHVLSLEMLLDGNSWATIFNISYLLFNITLTKCPFFWQPLESLGDQKATLKKVELVTLSSVFITHTHTCVAVWL